jgi:DNA transformation protein
MATSVGFAEFVKDQLAGLGHVSIRRMFGGSGVFCDGLMFAIVADDTLFLKADDSNRPAFEAEDLEPLTYEARGRVVQLPYWQVPERLFDEPDEMVAWALAALAAARHGAAARRAASSSADLIRYKVQRRHARKRL